VATARAVGGQQAAHFFSDHRRPRPQYGRVKIAL
jgi:hypothetical protein